MKGVWLLALMALGAGAAAGQALMGRGAGLFPPARSQSVNEAAAPIHAAALALDQAYRAAAAGGHWAELVELGHAFRRLGHVAGDPATFDAAALATFRAALTHARRQTSLDGVLRAAEGFGELGDRNGLKESVRIAELLAAGDPEAEADLRTLTTRFADQLAGG